MDSPVNPPYKRIGRQKSNGACEQAIDATGKKAVAKEQQTGDEACDMQFGEVIPKEIAEDPDAAAATNKEGLPPPVIVLLQVSLEASAPVELGYIGGKPVDIPLNIVAHTQPRS